MQRFTRAFAVIAAIASSCLISCAAIAGEQMLPLAESGDWIAAEHTDSITDPPDLCIAATSNSGQMFGFRVSELDDEVRFSDERWSLPANVSGTLVLTIGSYRLSLDITDNTNNMVIATVTEPQLQSLISAMDKAGSMTVAPGKDAPITVSLNGSNTATTAFLTCAGITAPGEGGGANPFQ